MRAVTAQRDLSKSLTRLAADRATFCATSTGASSANVANQPVGSRFNRLSYSGGTPDHSAPEGPR